MLNPFPDLLAFGLIAPFLLRLAVGVTFLEFGWKNLGRNRGKKAELFETLGLSPGAHYAAALSVVELAVGACLIAGFYTQIAALLAAAIALASYTLKKKYPERFGSSARFFCLLFVVSLSLIFSGAGFFAFDLPL